MADLVRSTALAILSSVLWFGCAVQPGLPSGGTDGDVDPCTAPLPEAADSSLNVDVYAIFPDTRQGSISFADDGSLYVGNFGPEGSNDAEARPILRVNAAATQIDPVGLVRDPDVVIVDVVPSVASAANNIFVGGVNLDGDGQLTEIRSTGSIADEVVQPCIGNVNVMLMLDDGRLLFSNFDTPNVCVATRNQDAIEVTELIANLEGEEPAGGLAQDPATGDLFITTSAIVRRYGVDGTLKDPSYYSDGTAIGYGPADSAFDGLLLRSGARLDLRANVEEDQLDVTLLDGPIGTFVAFYPDDENADLYISDPNHRILRVSTSVQSATGVGCQ